MRQLYRDLGAAGFAPWLDQEDILPGQSWERAINQAMHESEFVILCLSQTSIAKTGYVQTEMKAALELLSQYADDVIYLIPARLDNCPIPKSLERRQSVDLFTPNGLKKVIKALDYELARRRGQSLKKVPTDTFPDIGFSVDAATMRQIARLQSAADQLEPHLQSIFDSQGELTMSAQAVQKSMGQMPDSEKIGRGEYIITIIEAAMKVMEANQPLLNFLSYSAPEVGIGPGNIEIARGRFNQLGAAVPALVSQTKQLVQLVNGAPWLGADGRASFLSVTRNIQTQAAAMQKKIAAFGKI